MVLEPVAMDEEAFLKRLEALRIEVVKEYGDVRSLLKNLVPTFTQGEEKAAG